MCKNSGRRKGSVTLLLRSGQLNLTTRLMLAYLGKHVESSSDFVFQKLYVQIIRRFSANIYICGDRSCHILQDFNQKIEGAILTEEFQFKTASTCTTYEGWRAVAKVMRPKQCQLTVRLCKPSARLFVCCAKYFWVSAWNVANCQVTLFRASAMLPIGLQ
jgi:hypothetical protein